MTIQTIEDLIEFVDKNYDRITHAQYQELCSTCLYLYEYRKPDTKQKTIDRILDLYAFGQNYPSVKEMPLFVD